MPQSLFQHTAARRRLLQNIHPVVQMLGFQHTAARRRLHNNIGVRYSNISVSTHSRAEAAAARFDLQQTTPDGFNTQPRGGGCDNSRVVLSYVLCFNTQPRGGGCNKPLIQLSSNIGFNTQPRGGGCFAARLDIACKRKFQHTAARRRLRAILLS